MIERSVGPITKMQTHLPEADNPIVDYHLSVGEQLIPMNERLNQRIKLVHTGAITCLHCGRKTKKSFNQGFCYPCFKKLAQCDVCIMSPEKCHHAEGTCREPEWAEQFCMTDHFVYLANSSGVKVGITRGNQIPTRWMDQGAVQAMPIFRVSNRKLSGLVEVLFKKHVADKTNWRTMLKGGNELLDLAAERDRLFNECQSGIANLQSEFGLQAIQPIADADTVHIDYPVIEYPTKVTSLNFDKQAEIEGVLMGIKGQYLILDIGVLNVRKFGGYQIEFSF